MELRGLDLRYLITSLVLADVASTAELRHHLATIGVDLGDDPRRRLHGALRSEVRRGRLRRIARGRYAAEVMPRSTRSHILRRVEVVRASIAAGEAHPPRRHRYGSASTPPPLDGWPLL